MGPHRDGYEIMLDSKNLKFYSSGERKINLLKIYIAFIEFYRNEKGEPPIFLVDDYDTAIDDDNIAFLVDRYPDIQVIATSVNINKNFDNLIELNREN
jgi:recombinational DNA repair ATPase RecF